MWKVSTDNKAIYPFRVKGKKKLLLTRRLEPLFGE
jgi:hypothetical protein